ncbi:hypothetical protein ANO11243_053250 [Dothideomycetidae sp. 11243]|nr:hypothetical protein ANO11243_053250 [fungal sp. No.11243]
MQSKFSKMSARKTERNILGVNKKYPCKSVCVLKPSYLDVPGRSSSAHFCKRLNTTLRQHSEQQQRFKEQQQLFQEQQRELRIEKRKSDERLKWKANTVDHIMANVHEKERRLIAAEERARKAEEALSLMKMELTSKFEPEKRRSEVEIKPQLQGVKEESELDSAPLTATDSEVDTERQSSESNFHHLTEELHSLQAAYTELRAKHEDLEGRNTGLESETIRLSKLSDDTASQNADLSTETNRLKEALDEAGKKNADIQTETDRLSKALTDAVSTNAVQKSETDRLSKALTDAVDTNAVLQSETDRLSKTLTDAISSNTVLKSETDRLSKALDEAVNTRAALEEDLQTVREQGQQLATEHHTVQESMPLAEAAYQKIVDENKILKAEIEAAKQDWSAKMELAQSRHDQVLAELATAKQEKEVLQTQLQTATEDKETGLAQLQTAHQSRADLEAQLVTATEQAEMAVIDLETARTEHSQERAELHKLQQERHNFSEHYDAARHELSQTQVELDEAIAQKNAALANEQTAKRELLNVQGMMDLAVEEHGEISRAASAALAQEQSEKSWANSRLARARKELSRCQSALKSSKELIKARGDEIQKYVDEKEHIESNLLAEIHEINRRIYDIPDSTGQEDEQQAADQDVDAMEDEDTDENYYRNRDPTADESANELTEREKRFDVMRMVDEALDALYDAAVKQGANEVYSHDPAALVGRIEELKKALSDQTESLCLVEKRRRFLETESHATTQVLKRWKEEAWVQTQEEVAAERHRCESEQYEELERLKGLCQTQMLRIWRKALENLDDCKGRNEAHFRMANALAQHMAEKKIEPPNVEVTDQAIDPGIYESIQKEKIGSDIQRITRADLDADRVDYAGKLADFMEGLRKFLWGEMNEDKKTWGKVPIERDTDEAEVAGQVAQDHTNALYDSLSEAMRGTKVADKRHKDAEEGPKRTGGVSKTTRKPRRSKRLALKGKGKAAAATARDDDGEMSEDSDEA